MGITELILSRGAQQSVGQYAPSILNEPYDERVKGAKTYSDAVFLDGFKPEHWLESG